MLHLNAAGLRAVAYDHNGHGHSTDRSRHDYDAIADDLASVLDTFDLTGVVLVAHSGAGGEAIRYLSRYGSARIERLILVAAGPCVIGEAGVTAETVNALSDHFANELSG